MLEFLKRKVVAEVVDRDYVVVGIDPGIHGAIAVIKNNYVLSMHDMPLTDDGKVDCAGLIRLLQAIRDMKEETPMYFVVEQVPPTVGMVGNSASQFKLGVNYGKAIACVQTVLMDTCRSMVLITPKKWQYALGLKDYKESIEFVKNNFINPHTCQGPRGGWKDGRTDAVCIAYGAYNSIKRGEWNGT